MGMGVGLKDALRRRERQLVSRLAWADSVGREGEYVDSAREELPIVREMLALALKRMPDGPIPTPTPVRLPMVGVDFDRVRPAKRVVTDATPRCSECGRALMTSESIARGIVPSATGTNSIARRNPPELLDFPQIVCNRCASPDFVPRTGVITMHLTIITKQFPSHRRVVVLQGRTPIACWDTYTTVEYREATLEASDMVYRMEVA